MRRRPAAPARLPGLARLEAAVVAWLPLLFLAWAIPAGLALAWTMPPWQNADEAAHVERIVQISLGHMMGTRLDAHAAGGLTDPGVNDSAAPLVPLAFHPERRVTAAMLAAARAPRWGHPAVRGFDNTANYAPLLYAAAVPAAWIGRAARMPVADTLRLMRAFDAVAAAAVGAAALAAARRTRLAIAAVLVLPMSLALAAAATQDALLIPLAALAAALVDRGRAEGAGLPLCLVAAAALLAVILGRPPMLPLALLLFLLPGRRVTAAVLAGAVAVATVAWSVAVARQVTPLMNGADPARGLALLLHHPLAFPRVLWATFDAHGWFYLASAVGVLGWLDTWLPRNFILAAAGVVLGALLSAAVPEPTAARGRWVAVAAVLGALLGVFAAIYLTWTPLGTATVEGIQGRYFLPLLPALALSVPSLGPWARALRPVALAAVLALAAATPAVTLWAVVGRYYVAP